MPQTTEVQMKVTELLHMKPLSAYEVSSEQGGFLSQRITNLYELLKKIPDEEVTLNFSPKKVLTLEDVADMCGKLKSRFEGHDRTEFESGLRALRLQAGYLKKPPITLGELHAA